MSFNATINDIAEVVMGQSPKGEECNSKGLGLPLLNGPTEFTSRSPIPVQFTEGGKKFAEPDDILFCVRGSTTGRMNYADQRYVIGRGIAAIRGKNGYPTPYVRAVIEQNLNRLLASATGSTFPNVGRDLLNNFEINSVPLEDAREINKLILSLECKITLNRQINQTLESMAQTIFKSWFVNFDPVKAKITALESGEDAEGVTCAAMRAISGKTDDELDKMKGEQAQNYAQLKSTAELFPSAMQDSELGEVPEGWEVGTIADLCISITNGGTPKRMENRYWTDGTIPWYKTGELFDEPLLDSEEHITEEGLKKSSCHLWEPNTILIALYASPTVGRLGLMKTRGTANQACSGLVAKTEVGYPFLFFTLLFERANFNMVAVGSAQQNISQQIVKDQKIVIPPSGIASDFKMKIEPLFDTITLNITESRTLATIRDALLPKLLSGELSIDALKTPNNQGGS